MAAIIGVLRESRITVITTGSVTLILLLLGIFNRNERTTSTSNSTFSLLYFLAIVMLSFAFSAMLKERQQQRDSALGQQTGQRSDPNSTQFAVVVLPPDPSPQQSFISPLIPSANIELNGFKDPPPPYFSDNSPPPKYEEVVDSHK